MRVRVSSSTLRRLEALEQRVFEVRPVAMWPKMIHVDKWSVIAANMQAALKADVRGGGSTQYSTSDVEQLELIASE